MSANNIFCQFRHWIFAKLFWGVLRHIVSDRRYAHLRYRLEHQRTPDLNNPSRFTEKIQWIKLNERSELRKWAADRLQARTYVSKSIGNRHLVPLHDTFDTLTAEKWDSLPNQFVLKANHGCGMVSIIKNKADADFQKIYRETADWLATDYSTIGREWAYEGLKRTILAEELLLDETGRIPNDYKFFCFHGKVKIIQIDFDRFGDQKRNLYDRNFNQIEGELLYPNFDGPVSPPSKLDEAISLAETLAKPFSFIRVDLYIVNHHIYVGELTNYPGAGFVAFKPESLELKAGSFLKLPTG